MNALKRAACIAGICMILVATNARAMWTIISPDTEIEETNSFVGGGMTDQTGTILFTVHEFDSTEPDFKGDELASRAGTISMMMWSTTGDVIAPPTGGWVDQSGADLYVDVYHGGASVTHRSVEVN